MRDKDISVYVGDIWECIQKIEAYTSDITEEEFSNSTEKQDAVIRRLEIIGEAVKKLPDDFKQKHSHIPWRKMAGMRDIIVHEYFGVSIEVVWRTATIEIPELREQIYKIRQQ